MLFLLSANVLIFFHIFLNKEKAKKVRTNVCSQYKYIFYHLTVMENFELTTYKFCAMYRTYVLSKLSISWIVSFRS